MERRCANCRQPEFSHPVSPDLGCDRFVPITDEYAKRIAELEAVLRDVRDRANSIQAMDGGQHDALVAIAQQVSAVIDLDD